jgi:protein-S-isoprenylcysteine O-methyltransferase Ste14
MGALIVRGLLGGASQLVLLAALLLLPAGTWEWPRAIQFLVTYGVVLFAAIVWLAAAAPASLEARLEPAISRKQPVADRVATAFIGLAVGGWMVFIPLDVFRLHVFQTPSLFMSRVGAIVGLAGFAVILIALYQNAFATPVVRHQSERGHTLVDTGLYRHVRHPFYTGFIVALLGLALWLESYAAVLGIVVVIASLVGRILVEENHLRDSLPGYADYMNRVQHRLIPGVW